MVACETYLFPLEELFIKIARSRQVTAFDFNLLSLALFSDRLNDEERRAIQRVFHGVRRGWLTVSDFSDDIQLSTTVKDWLKENCCCKA